MRTLYYNHPDFLLHATGLGHPESPDRLRAITKALDQPEFSSLIRRIPPPGTAQQIQLIHPLSHLQRIHKSLPAAGLRHLDNDTVLSASSELAAYRAVGAACEGVDWVLTGQADNVFCAVRPPGHHAEPDRAMGFCLFNNVAIAAEYARHRYAIKRVAIVDFDVHHGNGTQVAFYQQPQVLYASSHEMPHYPGTGLPSETGVGNIFNVPLAAGDTGVAFKKKYENIVFPALNHFKPELLLISAGFDAHQDDPLASIGLVEEDYRWVTQALMDIAERHCQNRIVSVLEGGYHLKALAASAAIHVKTLMGK